MGITGGIMLASQGAVAATGSSAPVMLAANSCGGGSYAPNSGSYAPGSNYTPSSGSYAPNGNAQNSCGGGSYSSGRGSSGYYVPETGMDEGSVSEDDQPAGMRNQPGTQPNGCNAKSGCGGIRSQPQTSQQMRQNQMNQQQNTPNQAPQQMMPQSNAPSGYGPTTWDNANKRADMNR